MGTLGIVDLGSNTARLSVFEYVPERWYRLSDEIRERVRLGEGMGQSASLSRSAIDRADAVLRLFSDFARATELGPLEVIATSAVRDAENRDQLLTRIDDLPLQLKVLSGEQEGELSVTTVANTFNTADAWVVDLGGGSVQISQMVGRRCISARSLPLGVVRLRERFLPSEPESAEEVAALRRGVKKALRPIVREIRESDLPIIAIGGTIRNLARAVQKRRRYPLRVLHNYVLEREDLSELIEERLIGVPTRKRARVGGINPDRADVILGGALLWESLLKRSRRDRLMISGAGVREGVLFQHLLPKPHRVDDVRGFSVMNLLQKYPQPPRHVERVRSLARQLFDGLASLHDMDSGEADLLDAAAVLHDIGMAVGYHHHHKHGSYLVTSARLDGVDHREQALIALLVRYHRRGEPRLGIYEGLMKRDDERRLLQLATCLRLAEQFERARAGRVNKLRIRIGPKRVEIGGESLEEPSVELWEARKQGDLFERAFGRRMKLHSTDGGRPD